MKLVLLAFLFSGCSSYYISSCKDICKTRVASYEDSNLTCVCKKGIE